MNTINKIVKTIQEQEWLEPTGDVLQNAVTNAFKAGGKAGAKIKNFLHGSWLGHPLHPILTDIPIGAWTTAAVMDGFEIMGEEHYKNTADGAISVGLVGAAGAAATGLTDWTGTTGEIRKVGLTHALLNGSATVLYASSLILRKRKSSRATAIGLAMLGYGCTVAAAYLGGHLVYGEQVGVDHTATSDVYPLTYTPVLPKEALRSNEIKCVKAKEVDVLLVKKGRKIYALANTCSHLGGPLSDGEVGEDCSITCPWHQSEFSLEDGHVINGPATEPQPKFDARIRKGQIEVRLSKSEHIRREESKTAKEAKG